METDSNHRKPPQRVPTEPGATSERVKANVLHYRQALGMSTRELAETMTRQGHPTAASAISKIETGRRRVDVDDLTALALALDVSPTTLLMPAEDSGGVDLTGETSVPWQNAWRWAHGEMPLPTSESSRTWETRAQWANRNRPYWHGPWHEALRILEAHEAYSPFRIEGEHDGTDWVKDPTITHWPARPKDG